MSLSFDRSLLHVSLTLFIEVASALLPSLLYVSGSFAFARPLAPHRALEERYNPTQRIVVNTIDFCGFPRASGPVYGAIELIKFYSLLNVAAHLPLW